MDGVSNAMLKRLSSLTVLCAARLFKLLCSAGVCPDFCRVSTLFPISTGKPVVSALDLRPIALTSNLGKLFERVINDSMMKCAMDNDIIPHQQHGFLRGKSTVDVTTKIAQSLRGLKKSKAVAGLFLDVKKAYNSVWHGGLVCKLISLGFPETAVRWTSDWLRARRCITRVRDVTSSARHHLRGAPQGTVLSPLLFLVFFSDVVAELFCEAMLFADDLSVFTQAFKVGKTMVCSRMQRDVQALVSWGKRWKM